MSTDKTPAWEEGDWNPVSVVIGGDFCPAYNNESLARNGEVEKLFGDVLPVLKQADLTALNLECPLTSLSRPRARVGAALRAHPETIRLLQTANLQVAAMGNNHILDFGPEGLEDTLAVCRRHNIAIVGAGVNLEQALRPLILQRKGLRIGILALAGREFTWAKERTAGSAPNDPLLVTPILQDLAKRVDAVIILLHNGIYRHKYPSPRLQQLGRYLIDQGATAVLAQASHIIGTWERYKDGAIVYGQGNFFFDFPQSHDWWRTALLVRLKLKPGGALGEVEFIPVYQEKHGVGINLLQSPGRKEVLRGVEERSREIQDPARVDELWETFVRDKAQRYRTDFFTRSRFLRRLVRYTNLDRLVWRRSYYDHQLNLTRFEDHREVLETMLERGF